MTWNVYLSGEIHSDWREQIIDRVRQLKLPVEFTSAVTDHDDRLSIVSGSSNCR